MSTEKHSFSRGSISRQEYLDITSLMSIQWLIDPLLKFQRNSRGRSLVQLFGRKISKMRSCKGAAHRPGSDRKRLSFRANGVPKIGGLTQRVNIVWFFKIGVPPNGWFFTTHG